MALNKYYVLLLRNDNNNDKSHDAVAVLIRVSLSTQNTQKKYGTVGMYIA